MREYSDFPEFESTPNDLEPFEPTDLDQINETRLFPARRFIKKGSEFLLDLKYEETIIARPVIESLGESYEELLHFCSDYDELIHIFHQPDLIDNMSILPIAAEGGVLEFSQDLVVELKRQARRLTDIISSLAFRRECWVVGIPFDTKEYSIAAKLDAVTVTETEGLLRLEPVVYDQDNIRTGLLPDGFFHEATLYSRHVVGGL
jgi:hypothetical protein